MSDQELLRRADEILERFDDGDRSMSACEKAIVDLAQEIRSYEVLVECIYYDLDCMHDD